MRLFRHMPLFRYERAGPRVALRGEKADLRGAGGAVLLGAAQPSPGGLPAPLPCPHPGSTSALPLFKRGASICLGQRENDFFSVLGRVCHEPVPLAFCDAQESSGSRQIASAVLTSVPVPQPVSPAAGTLLLANALAGMILDFKHIKKPKGKTKPQNCEARILHRAGFLCENPKAVPVYSWVLRRVSISFKPFRGWQSSACSNLF